MSNEAITEQLLEEAVRNASTSLIIERQQSQDPDIKRLLGLASKRNTGNPGFPDHIIHNPESKDRRTIVITECKANISDHESEDHTNPVKYAVDGALHYANALKEEFDVVAIGVSGNSLDNIRLTSFYITKDSIEKIEDTDTLSFDRYATMLIHSSLPGSGIGPNRLGEVIKGIQKYISNEVKVPGGSVPLLILGSILALQNKPFSDSYMDYDDNALAEQWVIAFRNTFKRMTGESPAAEAQMRALSMQPSLIATDSKNGFCVLAVLLNKIKTNLLIHLDNSASVDILGAFYSHFLRHSSTNNQDLGIVLTPKHITDLCVALAEIDEDSVVLDPCVGTGGFLIAAHQSMIGKTTDPLKLDRINDGGLVGSEIQPDIHTMVKSNFIIRNAGRSNIILGDFFDKGVQDKIRSLSPTAGLINPPYSQKTQHNNRHEFDFIDNMLNLLKKDSYGVAIIPIACAGVSAKTRSIKQKLMLHHTLVAVMSLPETLFCPYAMTRTCIMVWKAHRPHNDSDRKTWFGRWMDDGFGTPNGINNVRGVGRVDLGDWNEKMGQWLSSYKSNEIIPALSAFEKVTVNDSWVPEAYLEPEPASITKNDVYNAYMDLVLMTMNVRGQRIDGNS